MISLENNCIQDSLYPKENKIHCECPLNVCQIDHKKKKLCQYYCKHFNTIISTVNPVLLLRVNSSYAGCCINLYPGHLDHWSCVLKKCFKTFVHLL